MNLTPAEIKAIRQLLKDELDLIYDNNYDDAPKVISSLAKKFNL